MIQIAICDDSEVTLQHLNQSVNTILKSNQEAAAITLYSSSESLNYDIEEGHFFDLILTDIEMPHMNGMELAATIRTYLSGALIIFITAYTKYALDAFELSAFRYIDKEMLPEKLPTAIRDAFRILHMQTDQYYPLSNTRMYRKLLLKDILYISREGKNSIFHLTNQTEIKERKSLNPVMEELNSSDFVFADRGIIVNLIHIVSIQDTMIELDNGEFLPASLARIKELKLLLQNGGIDLMIDNCQLDKTAFDSRVYRTEYLLLAVPAALDVNREAARYQIPLEMIHDGSFQDSSIAPVPLERFSGEPYIMLKPDNDTRKRAVKILAGHNITPDIRFELDQQLTSYNITCSGMGISFISDTLIKQVPFHPGVVYYKLDGSLCQRNLYFYWKNGRYFSRAMEEFLNIAKGDAKPA